MMDNDLDKGIGEDDGLSSVADVIKDLRQMTGLSQAKFAEKFSIGVSNIQHWEQGVSTPPKYVVSMMKDLLNMEQMLHETRDFDSVADDMRELRAEIHDTVVLRDHAIVLLHALAEKYVFDARLASGDGNKASYTFSDDELLELLQVNIEDLQDDVKDALFYIFDHPYVVRTDDREIHTLWLDGFSYSKCKGLEVSPNKSLYDVFSWISKSPEPEYGLAEYL